MNLNEVEKNFENTFLNIIFIDNTDNTNAINFEKLNDNFLIFSSIKNKNINKNNKLITIPTSINNIQTTIVNFTENLKIKIHDIVANEKLTNIKSNSFCYLTKLETEILTHLIIEKESTKKYIQENILNIKSTIQTNSLESHLTRIRKKMNQIGTTVKIQSKNEKLLIII